MLLNRTGAVVAEIMTTGEVQKALGLSEVRIRQLADSGQLPCYRTLSGQRFFLGKDVFAEIERRKRLREGGSR